MCHLSIIIPAHNEEERLPATLNAINNFTKGLPYKTEILVVENGSHDRTLDIAKQFALSHSAFRVIQETQPGKGLAVKHGMLAAKGTYRIFCDADLSVPIDQTLNFLPPLCDVDIAIASRESSGSKRYDEPWKRHLTGRLFNLLVSSLILPDLRDTQCGFKAFRGSVADDVFRYQTMNGWSFDVEILYIARIRGYSVCEIPVPWYYQSNSKVKLLRDSLSMLSDIVTIRRNSKRKLYDARTII